MAGRLDRPPEHDPPMSADRVRWEHIQRIYETTPHPSPSFSPCRRRCRPKAAFSKGCPARWTSFAKRSTRCRELVVVEAIEVERPPVSGLLRAQFGKGEPAAPASPSRGPGNGILRAETGGLFQAQNAGEQSEFGSQTTLRLTNPPELRGFLSTRKPPRFVGTAWWRTQSSRTSLRRPKFSDNANLLQ